MSEHEKPNLNHGILRSGFGGPTFANQTERYAYVVTADDALEGRIFRQIDTTPPTDWIAISTGTGSSKWRLLGDASSSSVSTAQTTANNAATAAGTAQTTANNAASAASTAQGTANTASSNASTALSTANTAQSTANTASSNATTALSNISTHSARTDNPHTVTAAQVGGTNIYNELVSAGKVGTGSGKLMPGDASGGGGGGASLSNNTPVAIVPDATGSAGVDGYASRSDHTHAIVTAAPSTNLDFSTTNAEGVASSFARSDHTHAFTTPAAPVNITKATAAVGTSNAFARADHKHDITTATPSSIGTTNTEGASTSLARADHVHSHGNQTSGSFHALFNLSNAGFYPVSNLTANRAPNANDDSADGYQPASMWFNTAANDGYICVNNSVGAAVWKAIGGSAAPTFASIASSFNANNYIVTPIARCVINPINLIFDGYSMLTAAGNGVFPQKDCDNIIGGLVVNDRVLVPYSSNNVGAGGIYVVSILGTVGSTLTLIRDSQFDTAAKLSGATVRVLEGFRHKNTTWTCTKVATLGTSVAIFRRDVADPKTWIDRVEEWAGSDFHTAAALITSNNTTIPFGPKGFGYYVDNNATMTRDSLDGADSALHRLGVLTMNRNATAAGRATILAGFVVLDQHIEWNFYESINFPTVSDGTNTYSLYGGALSASSVEGLYWNVVSGNIVFHAIASSVDVTITGPAATAGQWFDIWIFKPIGENNAYCFVDNVLIGTFTAGQFGTSQKCRLATQIQGTLGNANRIVKLNRFGDTIYDPLA